MKTFINTFGYLASTVVWIVAYFTGDLEKATFFLVLSITFPINKLLN